MDGICKRCGLAYEACKYPISHSHPTVDNISNLSDGSDSGFSGRDYSDLMEFTPNLRRSA